MIIKPKNQNRMIAWYIVLGLVLVGGVSIVSWLLFDNIQNKTWEEIKTMIVASIVSYLAWLQLAYRLILDIVLYIRKFKSVKDVKIELIESTSAYLPKETKKIKQSKDIEKHALETKIGDNLVKITPKEIVVVYGREYIDKEDFLNSISYTLGEIKETIRKKE